MTRHSSVLAQRSGWLLSCAVIALAGMPQAQAQTDKSTEAAPIETVIVTGTPIGRAKVDAAFSVSTMSEEELQRAAPLSVVDMLKSVPGFSAEPSGGEGGGGNIYVRGLPGGGWKYVQLQEDGLILFGEPQDSFLNIDSFDVTDMMTQRVEVVRGGTAPVFADNAPGGIVNIITRRGTDTPEGAISITGGNHGYIRGDGYSSGPLTDKITYAVGGYLRQDDGYREPGFTADRGGQIRGSLSFNLGDVHIDVDAKYLNDRNIFYTALPLIDPTDSSKSLSNVLSPLYGTVVSKALEYTTLKSFNGSDNFTESMDLSDGIHTKVFQTGVSLTWNISDGLILTDKIRYVNAHVVYNGVFSGSSPVSGAAYLASSLTKAVAGFGASVSSVKYVDATTGSNFDPSRASDGLVMETGLYRVRTNLSSFVNDLQLTKEFNDGPLGGMLGKHTISAGLFVNYYNFSQNRLYSNILVSVQNQPHLLDVVALNASGNTVGYVTDHGFARYGSGVYAGDANGYYLAPYFWDTVKFGDLSVDVGVRYTRYHADGGNYATGTRNLGDATTLADNNVIGLTGVYNPRSDNRNAFNWSAGIQYKFIPQAEVFARYTSAERLPTQSTVYITDVTPNTPIKQAEGGVRVVFDSLSFSATTFWSRFKNLSTSTAIINPDASIGTLYLKGDTQTIGEELEFEWKPIEFFSIQGSATIQNPETQSLTNTSTGLVYPGMDGKQLSRIPKYIYSATPTFYYNVFGKPVEVSATVYYMGKRFVDYSNHTELPAFTTIDLSVSAQLTEKIDLRLNAQNLTNTNGITEGNPRTDTVGGQETSDVNYGRPIFGAIYKMSLTYKW